MANTKSDHIKSIAASMGDNHYSRLLAEIPQQLQRIEKISKSIAEHTQCVTIALRNNQDVDSEVLGIADDNEKMRQANERLKYMYALAHAYEEAQKGA